MQRQIVEIALDLLENASETRTTVQTPFAWSDEENWRDEYMKIDESNLDQLRMMGEQRRLTQIQIKEEGMARTD